MSHQGGKELSCHPKRRSGRPQRGELALQGDKTPPRFILKINLMALQCLETKDTCRRHCQPLRTTALPLRKRVLNWIFCPKGLREWAGGVMKLQLSSQPRLLPEIHPQAPVLPPPRPSVTGKRSAAPPRQCFIVNLFLGVVFFLQHQGIKTCQDTCKRSQLPGSPVMKSYKEHPGGEHNATG